MVTVDWRPPNRKFEQKKKAFEGPCWWCCKLQTFLQGYVISLCAVVVRCRAPLLLSILSFFSPFFVLLFCINIYLNNCYLIKCNKQQEKISCFQRKDSTPLLYNYIDKQSEFLSAFPTFSKQRDVPTSSFSRLIEISTFQHINRTFNFIFKQSRLDHCLTNVSINRMYRSATIF